MKIKLAILEKDQSYLKRIVDAFNIKYSDKLEIYSFSNPEIALSTLDSARIDVLIASDVFTIAVDSLPKKCGFAYFVEASNVDQVNEQRAICKFQKADLIYKQILSIYSEKVADVSGFNIGEDSTKIVAFTSVGCGAGTSSAAAAAAVHFSAKNKKVFYLNLENYGSSDVFFSGDGKFSMTDVIVALKRRNTNLPLKLESCVKQDKSGVFFYSQANIALDMYELEPDDKIRLISELHRMGSYDYIVVDLEFSLDKSYLNILQQAHSIVWVGDGSEVSNEKIRCAYSALSVVERENDLPFTNRLLLLYNKFSNKSGKTVGDIGIKELGGAPRYEHASTEQVLEQLSKMEMFDKIIS